MNAYKCLRKIIEKTFGFPSDPELATEYMWAWNLTSIRPYKVTVEEFGDFPAFEFKKGPVVYFCCANQEGKYSIGNIDGDGFFKQSRYKRRAILIARHLGSRPQECSKEEAVRFCAKAIQIDSKYKTEEVDTSNIELIGAEHSIINIG